MADPLFTYDALWEHQTVANDIPADPALVTVPAADWLGPAPAPFGIGESAEVNDYAVATEWAENTGLWIRRALVVDGQSAVRISGRIENGCYVYLDGDYIGAVNPSGAQRTDVPSWSLIIPKELATEGTHEIALLCLDEQDAPPGSTTYIYVAAEYLQPVFPFWPGVPLRETLEWVTDVLISENGTEDRTKVRVCPRQSLRMSYYIPTPYQRLAANLLYGARAEQWLVPLWPYVQSLGAVSAGLFELTVPTSTVDFRDNSLVLLWQSPVRYQVLSVDEVGSGELSLIHPTEAFEDAYIIPLVPGFMPRAPERTFDGARSAVSLSFVVEDNVELSVSAPAQYLGNDIYYDVSLLDGGSLSENIEAQMHLLDEQIGAVNYFAPWLFNRPARIHRMMGETLSEGWNIRKWLYRRAGRFRPFWQPSFEADLKVLSTGALTTTVNVSSDGYKRFAGDRAHIAVETASGWLPRAVTLATQIDSNTVRLTLSSSLGINASAIRRVSFLGLKRLDTDRAEIEWVGGNVSSVSVNTVEIQP